MIRTHLAHRDTVSFLTSKAAYIQYVVLEADTDAEYNASLTTLEAVIDGRRIKRYPAERTLAYELEVYYEPLEGSRRFMLPMSKHG